MSSNIPAEQKQALKAHVRAIAQILFDSADKDQMKSLGDIEVTIREQLQEHVSPELGLFLSKALQESQKAIREP